MIGRTAVLALALAALLGAGCSSDVAPAKRPNVLVIVLDTVRADRLSCYGHPRHTTPKIDALAAKGVRFTQFYSNSSWTLPAHASLFTGMYPVGHRATQETLILRPGPATLAEILSAEGYATWAASANPVVSRETGMARGFDEFVETYRPEHRTRYPDHPNNLAFARFLESADRQRPFFAFMNYVEAHTPYMPPPQKLSGLLTPGRPMQEVIAATRLMMQDHYLFGPLSAEQFALLNELYDAEVAFLDDLVHGLLTTLESDGRHGDTLVIITSDHGENIGDHGHFDHVFSIHNTLLWIPLIIRFPDGAHAGDVRTDTAQLLDLFPTILRLCGVDSHFRPEGRDLFAPEGRSVKATAMAEFYYPRQVLSVFPESHLRQRGERLLPYMRRLRAIQDGKTKLIWSSDGDHEFYRIADDPGELHNLAGRQEFRGAMDHWREQLASLIESHKGDLPLEPPPPVGWMMPGFEQIIGDPATRERLRSLGYID